MEFRIGDTISATIVSFEPDGVIVQPGNGSTAFVPEREILSSPVESMTDVLKVGQNKSFVVIEVVNQRVILSLKQFEITSPGWEVMQEHYERHEFFTSKILINTGKGLLVEAYGLRGFVPESHVRQTITQSTEIRVAVLEIERARYKIILSQLVPWQDDHAKARQLRMKSVRVHQSSIGMVTRIASYGIFVDIGDSLEGFLPLNYVSHRSLSIGELCEVVVEKITSSGLILSLAE